MFILIGTAPATASEKKVVEHTVTKGENLSFLAGYYFRNPRQWKKIYLQNAERIDDPMNIRPGDTFSIETTESGMLQIPYREYRERVYN